MNSASLLERSTTFLSGFSPKRLNPPNCANRPRSDQTTHREGRPQSRRPNPEPATSCHHWSWRGLHRRTTPGSFGFQHPETTPPSIPTTLRTAPHVLQDNTARTDLGVVADLDIAEHFCPS